MHQLEAPFIPSMHWSDVLGWEMLRALEKAEIENLKDELLQCDSGVVAVIIDESTAIDDAQYLAIGISWVRQGKKRNAFLALKYLDSTNSARITEVLVTELKLVLGIDFESPIGTRLVGLGCDGASVMVGSLTGVATRLKLSEAPYCQPFHCAAHRVNLVAKSFDSNHIYRQVETCLKHIYLLFSQSPKAQRQFRSWQVYLECDMSNGRRVGRIHDIRWLSVYPVLSQVLADYSALVMFAATKDSGSEDPVYHEMLKADVIIGARAVAPLLEKLHVLIKHIQQEDFMFEDLAYHLECFQEFVKDKYLNGEVRSLFGSTFQDFIKIGSRCSPLKWQGGNLVYCIAGMTDVEHNVWFGTERRLQLITVEDWEVKVLPSIIKEVQDLAYVVAEDVKRRFPDNELLNAFSILQPKYWEGKSDVMGDDIDFNEKLRLLVEFYGKPRNMPGSVTKPLIDLTKIRHQRDDFCHILQTTVTHCYQGVELKSEQTRSLWAYLCDSPAIEYISEFRVLATIMLLLPASSVWAERCFSTMNYVKNCRRNRLSEQHLNAAVRIFYSRYTLKDTEFFTQALKIFLKEKERRGLGLHDATT